MPTAANFGMTDDEIDLLRFGLREWGGPANLTDALATALGFADADDFFARSRRIRACLDQGTTMPMDDWRRTLLATEVAFVSDVVGSGIEWETTTGIQDATALRLLRNLQRKLAR